MPSETRADHAANTRAVWEYDCRSSSMVWSPEFGRLFDIGEGVTPTAHAWLQTIAAEDRAAVEQGVLHPAAGSDTVTTECRHLRGSDVVRTRITGRVFRDSTGAPIRIVGFGTTVTNSATGADAGTRLAGTIELLANRVAEFDAMMDVLPLPVAVAEDPECRFIRANRAFESMFDVERGTNVSVTAPEDQRPPWRAMRDGRELTPMELPMQRSAALGVRVLEEPILIVFDSGRELHLVCSVAPLFDVAGAPRGCVAVFNDITERRERERERDAFVSMVAHELRQPLGALLTAHELLSLETASRSALEIARRQTAQMTRIVDDLMDAARLSRGTLTLERHPVDVVLALRDTIESVAALVARRGQQIRLTGADRAVADADPARLRQVFTNLLQNACKFGIDGDEIHVDVELCAGTVSVSVTDHGLGITPEKLPRIFDLFTPASEAGRGGLGIGLHVVHSIVALHGGTIVARSDGPGSGATFTVTLPAAL